MAKRNSNEQLSQLSSMAQLHAAQRRVDRDIARVEMNVVKQYHTSKDVYSYMRIVCNVLKVADNVQSFVRYARSGYQAVKESLLSDNE